MIEEFQRPPIRRLQNQRFQHLPRQIRRRRPARRPNQYSSCPRILQNLRYVLVEGETLAKPTRHRAPGVNDRGTLRPNTPK